MSKKLLIVESPAKAKTISGYLDGEFLVLASFGHVRDLPSSKIGVDTKDNYKPTYIIPTKAKKNVNLIKKAVAQAQEVYLATDLDREGEAIAWHIVRATGLDEGKNKKAQIKRITFSEISKNAIRAAVDNPRDIDMDLVDAQQARRVLDRLVGYNLSPLLWKKVYRGLSAGRVQSVAVRLVVEREREIAAFVPQEYWSIAAQLEKDKAIFEARLIEENGKKIDKLAIKDEAQAGKILKDLEKGQYKVLSAEGKSENRYPAAPFTTSTLQQEAANILGFSAKQTMRLAQGLYESGLITYMRTDSVNISANATEAIRKYVVSKIGKDYIPEKPRVFSSKSKRAQEAHEAIRPVDFDRDPQSILAKAGDKEGTLYKLIWSRAVASQMKDAILSILDMRIANGGFIFASRGQGIKFDGWLKFYPQKINEIKLPQVKVGDILKLIELKKEQHFTEPPARYSEATLIKTLEEKGIGRPSTYAPTMSTIVDRGYVVKDKGRLRPEQVGFVVNDLLVENFPDVVDYNFTAHIEDDLDLVAEGKQKWQEVIDEFYRPFEKLLADKSDKIERKSLDEQMDEKCPECSKKLVIKHSKNGRFIGCTGFPDCKYTRNYVTPEAQMKIDQANESIKERKCPKCSGELKVVSGKWGPFIGCSKYPECKYIERIKKQPSDINPQPKDTESSNLKAES